MCSRQQSKPDQLVNEKSKLEQSKNNDNKPNKKLSFVGRILKLFKYKNDTTSARDTIEEIIEEDDTGQSIAQNEREMIGNVLDLRNTLVQDIMLPRTSIVSVPLTATIEEVLEKFVDNQLSTILVYQDELDNVAGILRLKDVANWIHMNKPFSVGSFIKDVLFIPPTMRTLDLLFKMKHVLKILY